jgi:hypothetical protein
MSSCLITKRGKVVDCNGNRQHEIICKRVLKIGLDDFVLKRGGVRVKADSIDPEYIAIEYHDRPSDAQMRIIRRILRRDDYYTVVLVHRTIQKFRPIRGFQI